MQRLRGLVVAAIVILIVFGCFHVGSKLLDGSGGASAPGDEQTHAPSSAEVVSPDIKQTKSTEPAMPPVVPGGKHATDGQGSPGTAQETPKPAPAVNKTAKPGRQSSLDDNGGSTITVAHAPPPDSGPSVGSLVNGAPMWSALNITGALPSPTATAGAPAAEATPPAVVFDDKLPARIGGPLLRAAALAGDPAAAYEVAIRFAEGRGVAQNSEEAVRWLERAARKGLAPAQFRLGGFYEKGIGVKKNLAKARDLYRAAADQGNGKAMHNLAVLYAEGVDGTADYRSAAQWFRKAADHGVTDSQYNLAILYARGIGVNQNFAESYKWFSLAANRGDREATKKRDEMAARLDRQSLAAARLAAQRWIPESQPADAIRVRVPAAWEQPATGARTARSRARPAKATGPGAATTN